MEKWHVLDEFRCPVQGCEGGRIPCKWVCGEDNTLIQLAQTGFMKCSKSIHGKAAHYGQVCVWRWDCGRHGDHPFSRYQEADFQGFVFALSHALQLTSKAGTTWVATLCIELNKQYMNSETSTPASSGNTCSICLDRPVDVYLYPCGHTACEQDAQELQKRNNQCHLCTAKFTSIKKLFF